jgi:hypothetical protein
MESQPKQNDMNEKGGASKREERERRWWWEVNILKYIICMYKTRILKPNKKCKNRGEDKKNNRRNKFDPSRLCTSTDISQWNSFVQLIYVNRKENNLNYKT